MTSDAMTRRHFLAATAGAAASVGAVAPALALAPLPVRDARITRLIDEVAALPAVTQRIAFISQALLGTPYRGYTLIGGPHWPERFVVRDDVFDCVTFCETVLAAALSRNDAEFRTHLRLIRYRDGEVDWRARNHYFAEWCVNNVANHVCEQLNLPGNETVAKRLTWMRGLPPRRVAMAALPRQALLDNKLLLSSGDIIGFLSRRPGLDYFHTGFVIVADDGSLVLRHAAKSRGRVIDQPLTRFLADNHAHAVTLLRVREPADVAALI